MKLPGDGNTAFPGWLFAVEQLGLLGLILRIINCPSLLGPLQVNQLLAESGLFDSVAGAASEMSLAAGKQRYGIKTDQDRNE